MKISNGPNILTCIDVLISMREWHAMDCDTLTKDPDQPTEYLLPPPVGYLLGEHPLMGKTVNFFFIK